ncbi:serine hydrolase domain-containing protein [Herbiconiux liukaitaii]|uniref:serine hydrolase domain-containing protein n=1 Tax=Herbiconiux liukaitaii TaxID=3342799 RepID=UPI0035B915F6
MTSEHSRGRVERRRAGRRTGVAAVAAMGLLLGGCAGATSGGAPASSSTGAGSGGSGAGVTRSAAPEGELPEALQAELQRALDTVMAEYDVPGAVAGVWVPGEGSWTTAAGLADVEGDVAVTTEMTWPIRSITKSYTVTLLLQLADEGALSLDDTIDQYVDGITNGDEITLLELANMSSGNADYVNDAFIVDWQADPGKVFTLAELNSYVVDQPAKFAPGTDHVYTNANTNLLGGVIEEVTGQPYAEVLEERILGPLGQTGTTYITDIDDWAGPHPTGYMSRDGVQVGQDENPSILGAAGSLFSTLDDGRVWAETLGSGALLDPETQELRKVGHEIPTPPYDQYAVGMGETDGWWGHNGEGIGFTAATFHDPETGASIVVYMNESDAPDGSHPADQAFRALADALANGAGA